MGATIRVAGATATSMSASTQAIFELPVRDVARSRRFCEEALDRLPLGAKPDGKFVDHCGGTESALFPNSETRNPKPEGTKAEHTAISFKVADIATAIAELKTRASPSTTATCLASSRWSMSAYSARSVRPACARPKATD